MVKKEKLDLGKNDINSLLLKLSIPAITAMLVNAIYNLVDTLFVGMLNDTNAMGAISVAFPLFILIAALGQMIGIGSSSLISRFLGEQNNKKANNIASHSFISGALISIVFTLILIFNLNSILKLFGATDNIIIYAYDYSKILILLSFFNIMNMVLNNMIRAEGNSKYSMIGIILGALLNIILDPIFIFTFDYGIKGAALATGVSQIISFLFLISYYIKKKSIVKINIKSFNFDKNILSNIFKIGFASFCRQGLSSLSLGLINYQASLYSEAAVASIGICLRVISIALYVILGFNQGFSPIVGFNYGAKKFKRVKETIKLCIKYTSIFSIFTTIVFFIFSKQIISLFSNDLEVLEIGTTTLKAFALLFAFTGYQQVYSVLFQTLSENKKAMLLSLSRQGLFLLPAILILPKYFGLLGVIFAQPLADFLTIILTYILSKDFNINFDKKIKAA